MRFIDSVVSREHRYSLGTDADTGQPYLSIPVSNQRVDYEEYYRLSEHEFQMMMQRPAAAIEFAAKCGRRQLDERLIIFPGADRGIY